MPSARTLELLRQWALWSVLDIHAGPDSCGCGSAESGYRSPQDWDERKPKVVLVDDETALRVEAAVLSTGVVLAAAIRSYYILRHPIRTRAEGDLLREAVRRVGEQLGLSHATEPPRNAPRRRAWRSGEVDVAAASAKRL